nr:DBH-like monooxygenase protein 1 isoform X2 [Parasteatoda tepidariorum]
MPIIDSRADWTLLSGSENDTHTSLTIKRKLDTCDYEDMKIDDSTIRLIYAYSDVDPSSEHDLQYHQNKRGAKSVLLLQPNKERLQPMDTSKYYHWDLFSQNFEIKSDFHTMYWCKIYKAPRVNEKHHIVMVEPIVEEGNEQYVHHLVLYECVGADPDEFDPHVQQRGHECRTPNMPDQFNKCDGVAVAWAIGGESLIFPEHVGLPIDPGNPKYYLLEFHYDNPQRHNGIFDHSGLRMYYTSKLRKYDAATLCFGSSVSPLAFIPPGQKEFVLAGHSDSMCIDPVMPKDGVKLLGILLHAHLLGRHLKARHFRNGTELIPLGDDKNYDFNYQEYRYYNEEVTILPGDQITVECTYDSSDRMEPTFGGESTREEMCLAFLLYYPKIERFGSVSAPSVQQVNSLLNGNLKDEDEETGHLKEFLLNVDWKSIDMQKLENDMRYNEQKQSLCYNGNGQRGNTKDSVSYPSNFEPFKEKSSCPKFLSKSSGYSLTNNLQMTCICLSVFAIHVLWKH